MGVVVDPLVATQKAIFTLLDGALTGATGAAVPVFDRVPSRTPDNNLPPEPPYAIVGDDDVIDDGGDDYRGEYVTANVHVWSRYGGRIEAASIAGQVRALLSAELADPDGRVRFVCWRYERTRILDDPDGVSKHAVVTFRYGTEPLI